MEWEELSSADGTITILHLKGEIDLHHSPKLRSLLKEKSTQRSSALILDFSQVKYIDSSGLATLVEYFQATQEFNGKIALSGLNPRVKKHV